MRRFARMIALGGCIGLSLLASVSAGASVALLEGVGLRLPFIDSLSGNVVGWLRVESVESEAREIGFLKLDFAPRRILRGVTLDLDVSAGNGFPDRPDGASSWLSRGDAFPAFDTVTVILRREDGVFVLSARRGQWRRDGTMVLRDLLVQAPAHPAQVMSHGVLRLRPYGVELLGNTADGRLRPFRFFFSSPQTQRP